MDSLNFIINKTSHLRGPPLQKVVVMIVVWPVYQILFSTGTSNSFQGSVCTDPDINVTSIHTIMHMNITLHKYVCILLARTMNNLDFKFEDTE